MKFSVLIPTRNRLEYLRYAVHSVLQQDYDDWEIIISDNDSNEDIGSYIASLADQRIKYYRTKQLLSVTDNWNQALEKSTGDYVIMLGDDDCLLQGYFSYCHSLLAQFDFPELVYTSAINYVYPGVISKTSQGAATKYCNASFLVDKQSPFMLPKSESMRLVREILNFVVSIIFNMQHSLVSRKLINRMKKYGEFFQSPYPDYYATTALFIKAERILAVPRPMVVIGVTPKSFGWYYLNNKENQGLEFLHNTPDSRILNRVSKHLLPGTNMNTSWLLAMETILSNFGVECSLEVNYTKYRLLQVLHCLKKYALKEGISLSELLKLFESLFLWEKFAYFIPFFAALLICSPPNKNFGKRFAHSMAYRFSHPKHGPAKQIEGKFNNILEVFEAVKSNESCFF